MILLQSVIFDQWPTDSEWSVVWLGTAFISKCMWRQFNYYPHYVQQLLSARTGNRKSLDMTMFVTSQMNCCNAQQRVGYYKRKFRPQNQSMVRTLLQKVMSVDALQIYVILPKEMCATDAILSPWELMRYYLIMSHTKDIYTSLINEGIKRSDVDSRT